MSTSRFAEYNGWKIDAAPTYMPAQRLFVSAAVITRPTGERFVFTDLGNKVYRWQAHERAIEWALDRQQLRLRCLPGRER